MSKHNRNANRRPNVPQAPSMADDLGIKARPYAPTDAEIAEDLARSKTPQPGSVGKIPSFIPRELPIDPAVLQAATTKAEAPAPRVGKSGHPIPAFAVPMDAPLPAISEAERKFIAGLRETEDDIDREFNFLEGKHGNADAVGYAPGEDPGDVAPTLPPRRNAEPTGATSPANDSTGPQLLPDAPVRHPMLERMLATFGLERFPEKFEHIGNFKFGFRRCNTSDEAMATRFAALYTKISPAEYEFYLAIIRTAIGITSINDVPVHEIFGIDLSDAEKQVITRNPTNPPHTVTSMTAPAVLTFLLEKIDPTVLNDLAKAYDEAFRAQVEETRGDTANKMHVTYRFQCSNGCDETVERVPVIIDAVAGTYRPVFCPSCGKPMQAMGSLEDLANDPLA